MWGRGARGDLFSLCLAPFWGAPGWGSSRAAPHQVGQSTAKREAMGVCQCTGVHKAALGCTMMHKQTGVHNDGQACTRRHKSALAFRDVQGFAKAHSDA